MRGGVQLTIASVLLLELLVAAAAHRCDRTPEGHVAPKIPADNRFQLKISGSPDKYVPNEGYTISLHGLRNHGLVAQKFTGFMLVVEPLNHMPLRVLSPRDFTPRPVGTFQLYGDTLTKFSPSCPNMVTHTSSMPKSEVQVRWTAPPPGSGCVIFRATVIEHRDVWYQDDGPLSKMLCEDIQESHDTQPEVIENCCACDEAKYEVTFEGLWSRHTHPKDFPSNSWLTRFSDVIGASHSMYYRFWEYGGIASEGLRLVAERGSTRLLESELKSQSQHIRTIIKARGISYPNVTGKTFAVFRVDKIHHLMSLVSMIDPSPDWIVGVSGLELCLRNCSWVESKVLNLYPWDAGTDSGVTYISVDQATVPRDKIRRITSSFPNDPRSPFYDPSGAEMKPLARLYLTRQRLYEKTCDDEPTVPGENAVYRKKAECALSEWTDWGPCSTTCGPGQKLRQRHYLRRNAATSCRMRLTDKRSCIARQCRVTAQPSREEPVNPLCQVSEWGDWSRCEATKGSDCKEGIQKRYRLVTPRNSNKRKLCLKVQAMDQRFCRPTPYKPFCDPNEKKTWAPQENSSCCDGNSQNDNDYGQEEEEKQDEEVEGEEQPEEGVEEENNEGNEITDQDDHGDDKVEQEEEQNNEIGENDEDEMYQEPSGDCAMTQWSEWSPCSASCGQGVTVRTRKLLTDPEPGPRYERLKAQRNTEDDYGTYDENENENDNENYNENNNENGEDDIKELERYGDGPCSVYKVKEAEVCNGSYPPTCQFSAEDARANEEGEEELTTMEATTEDEEGLRVLNQRKEPSALTEGTESPVRNCRFSRWSPWSKCEAPCNQQGFKVRTRYIEVHAKNGGKDCVGKTRKQRRCIRRCKGNEDEEEGEGGGDENHQRNDGCEYSEWSDWSDCTATCGYHAVRQRTRQVLAGDPSECKNDRIHTRTCNVGPCPH